MSSFQQQKITTFSKPKKYGPTYFLIDINYTIPKEDIIMADKHMQRHVTSVIVTEMRLKTSEAPLHTHWQGYHPKDRWQHLLTRTERNGGSVHLGMCLSWKHVSEQKAVCGCSQQRYSPESEEKTTQMPTNRWMAKQGVIVWWSIYAMEYLWFSHKKRK